MTTERFEPVMSAEEASAYLDEVFPQIHAGGRAFHVEAVEPGLARLRLDADARHLRPGATVSGPTLFTLADLAAYVAILAHIGRVALAVTTHLSINFLRKPEAGSLVGTCRILKLGKRLAVVDVEIGPAGGGAMVAHAVATYSIPPGLDGMRYSDTVSSTS